MQEQLIKMAAAAIGVTPEAAQQTIAEMMQFVRTVDARVANIELMTADTARMMKALYELDFPPDIKAEPPAIEGKTDGGNSAALSDA